MTTFSRKILITGVTGFTGKFVLKYLQELMPNESIIGTGRNEKVANELRAEGYELFIGDLSDKKFVQSSFKEVTHIIHIAAKSSPWGDYQSFHTDNVIATRNLLQLPALISFIYISTPGVYFNFTHRFNVRESDPVSANFVNHYVKTKFMAEQEVLSFANENLIRIILRPRAIVGAGDTTIMPRVIRAVEENKLRIVGSGENMADFTSVKNLAHAISLAINSSDLSKNGIYNITDGQSKKFWPLLEKMMKELGYDLKLKKVPYKLAYSVVSISEIYHKMFTKREPGMLRYSLGVLNYSLTLNIDRAKSILGYSPIITTEESLQEFIDWHKNQK